MANDPTSDRMEAAAYWAARLGERSAAPESEAADVELERWLAASPLNADALKDTVQTWEAFDRLADEPEIEMFRQSALADAKLTNIRRRRWVGKWRQVAASIALLIAVGGAALWATFTPTTYATTTGERRVVMLSDGSRLSLDAETEVAVSYDDGRRMLWLEKGRAKFSVAKDPLRPFTVTAGDKIVVATGTEFSVERLSDHVRVVLYEGHVALLEKTTECTCDIPARPGSKVPAAQYLKPAHEIVLAAGPSRKLAADVDPVDPTQSLLWESGMLSFKDEPLQHAVSSFNRYSRKPLKIGDAKTSQLRISGTFNAADTEAVLEGLEAAFGVKSREDDGSIQLFR